MTRLTIYCEQYGYYWGFTPKEFLILCDKSINGLPDGFELPSKNELRGKPPSVYNPNRKPRGTKYPQCGRDAYSCSPDVILYHPLDWEKGDYLQAKKEVMQRVSQLHKSQNHTLNLGNFRGI